MTLTSQLERLLSLAKSSKVTARCLSHVFHVFFDLGEASQVAHTKGFHIESLLKFNMPLVSAV